MIERQPNRDEKYDVRHSNAGDNRYPGDRQWRMQAEVIQFVEPFFDTPIYSYMWAGPLVRTLLGEMEVSGLRARSLFPSPMSARCPVYRTQRDGNGEHDELDEPGYLAAEQEEDRDDAHDSEEQRTEQTLQ